VETIFTLPEIVFKKLAAPIKSPSLYTEDENSTEDISFRIASYKGTRGVTE
jgi:hypothetical protein